MKSLCIVNAYVCYVYVYKQKEIFYARVQFKYQALCTLLWSIHKIA